MEREAKFITIGNWSGPALLVDGEWYVRPQSIVEAMGFDWKKVRAKLIAVYGGDILVLQRPPGMSGKWKPLLLRLGAAMQWLAGLHGNNHMGAEKRAVAKQAASAIARQFAALVLEKGGEAASEQIVVLGGSDDR